MFEEVEFYFFTLLKLYYISVVMATCTGTRPLSQGSPNYGPWARCGPLGLSIQPAETLKKINK